MSSDAIANPQTVAPSESKSARKKKAKAEAAAAAVPAPDKSTSELGAGSSDAAGKTNGVESGSENGYIKELQKSVRNVNKKLNLMQKVDAIIEANPGISLDDLVSSRKINADQKAQALKKPGLQSQLAQLEEQIAQYKKFDQEYQQKIAQEKEILRQSHSEDLEKLRGTLKAEAAIEARKVFKEKFLTLSRFLRAAAARRQLEDDDSDLTKAFEGALLLVYGGDASAVAAAEKLIDGSEDNVPSTEGVSLSVTCKPSSKNIKEAALEEAPFAAEEAWVDDVAQSQPAPPETETETTPAITTDPTIANAGLTELNTGVTSLNRGAEAADTPSAPPASSVGAGAANAAAEEQWDKQPSGSDDPLAESFEMVPRDPAETESPAAVAPISSVQSWADEPPEPTSTTTPTSANGNDGFHEVHHNRGGRGRGGPQGESRGGYRGRAGQRGDYRGRSRGRGDFRGRGRGSGFRGGRGDSQ
ncbi:uncharacterized protein BDR25DRAFT_223317 [Lindgomyces ingoldianus]|uniref:Uncharacterized protein n=1 Tax=Lindgomyces ingoldianus TaxID=673940 RepID=A0ACB6QZ46_9PLEO|nr:uncharacterized protein BDR25DRAFT_223317 [Lindgomyces ingoldianus]KAF2471367.1 hypothetical protein BDR25DRAFT_223317 [Lindgomyces ingoldianus]